jgi:hypothetical protein
MTIALSAVATLARRLVEHGLTDPAKLKAEVIGVYLYQTQPDASGVSPERLLTIREADPEYLGWMGTMFGSDASKIFHNPNGVASSELAPVLALALYPHVLNVFHQHTDGSIRVFNIMRAYLFSLTDALLLLPKVTPSVSYTDGSFGMTGETAPLSALNPEVVFRHMEEMTTFLLNYLDGGDDYLDEVEEELESEGAYPHGDEGEGEGEEVDGGSETEGDVEGESAGAEEPPVVEAPATAEPEPEQEPEEEPQYDDEVIGAVNKILSVYKDLFEVGYELVIPKGILVSAGYITLKDGKTHVHQSKSLATLFNLIASSANVELVCDTDVSGLSENEILTINFTKGVNYYPAFQLSALLGVYKGQRIKSWSEMSKLLRDDLLNNITRLYTKEGVDLDLIVRNMTNCIVLSEFDVNTALKVRFYLGTGTSIERFEKKYADAKSSIFQGTGHLFFTDQSGEDKDQVCEAIVLFDKETYHRSPLFAYQAVKLLQERGDTPSIKNMILGRRVDGKILTYDFTAQTAAITLIGAGQRSGKGVLTLNILGTVLASGHPVIYADGKPDMAVVLWNLAKKYQMPVASYDFTTQAPGYTFGVGAPDYIRQKHPGVFGILMYLKVLMLMVLAAELSRESDPRKLFKWKNSPYFIFDEVLAMQRFHSSNLSALADFAATEIKKDTPPEIQEAVEWAQRVCVWARDVASSLSSAVVSQLPASGVKTFWLFQSINKNVWGQITTKGYKGKQYSVFEPVIYSPTSVKILGHGTFDGEAGLIALKNELGNLVNDKARHFVVTTSQKPASMDVVTVFKPFLVLNDVGGDAEAELKSVVGSAKVWDHITNGTGRLPREAGFEGFAELLGQSAISNLSLGHRFLGELLNHVGVTQYSDPSQFIFDASLDSFYSVAQLRSMLEARLNGGSTENIGYISFGGNEEEQGAPTGGAVGNAEAGSSVPSFTLGGSATNTAPIGGVSAGQPSQGNGQPGANGQRNGVEVLGDEGVDITGAEGGIPSVDASGWEALFGGSTEVPKASTSAFVSPSRTASTEGIGRASESQVRASEVIDPNKKMGYEQVYSEPFNLPQNPFVIHRRGGTLNAILAKQEMGKYLLNKIRDVVGDLSFVHTVELTATGIVVNGVAIRPKLTEEDIEVMPFALRAAVRAGNYTELFDLRDLYKFRNMHTLHLADAEMAELRFRPQLGFHPKMQWAQVAKKFRSLRRLYINGQDVLTEEGAVSYEEGGRSRVEFVSKLADRVRTPLFSVNPSYAGKLWNSYPVKITRSAVGWTLGVKAVTVAASLLGPWGLLMGAIAGYKVYTTYRDKRRGQ